MSALPWWLGFVANDIKSAFPEDPASVPESTVMKNYTVSHATPSVEIYIAVRAAAGLSSKTPQAATAGLANNLFAVQTAHRSSLDEIVCMNGDSGCVLQVADIAVLLAHQSKSLGKMIMRELKVWICKNVPKSGVVMLFTDEPAIELYKHFGSEETPGLTPSNVKIACRFR